MSHSENIAFSWESPEYVRNDRTVDWYWSVALLGIVGVIACVYFGNYLFGGVVLLSTILIIVYASRPVPVHPVSVSDRGITINRTFINYDHIASFWIEQHPREGYKLLLRITAVMVPISVIPIATEVDIAGLRSFLSEHASESEMKEPILIQLFEAIF